jgi:hypothetical protein
MPRLVSAPLSVTAGTAELEAFDDGSHSRLQTSNSGRYSLGVKLYNATPIRANKSELAV